MNPFVKALHDHYTAQISEAVATLNVYLNTSVGVGEHSDILGELKKYVDLLESADGKLAVLEKYINARPQQQQPESNKE
jgi:hypothetical protein